MIQQDPKFEFLEDLLKTHGGEFAMKGLKVISRLSEVFTPQHLAALLAISEVAKNPTGFIDRRDQAFWTHGWCVHPAMPIDLVFSIKPTADSVEVDRVLGAWFRDNLEVVETWLIKHRQDRLAVLTSAFRNHREGDFYASIPLFLAQADGIINEAFPELRGAMLFTSQQGATQRRQEILARLNLSDVGHFTVGLLKGQLPIWTKDGSGPITRNAILHGESLDYGTEINSLKSISLIAYMHRAAGHIVRARNIPEST